MIGVADNKIGNDGARALAGALKMNKSLVDIGLGGEKKCRAHLFFVTKRELILVLLRCSENKIGDGGAAALAEALAVNASAKRLELAGK